MIQFNCPNCAKSFSVPNELGGRRAKCKACGGVMTIPHNASPHPQPDTAAAHHAPFTPAATESQPPAPRPRPAPPPPEFKPSQQPAKRMPMRTRRLLSDAEHMAQAFAHSSIIRILSTEGDPPDLYRVEYRIRGLQPTGKPEEPRPRDVHHVEIQLTAEYPRTAPLCKMLTPVFHPNIDPSHICVGDHWAAGERLVDLVVRIGEMLSYQAYNIKSPLDARAAMWTDLNPDKLPTDSRTIRPAELE